VGRFDGANDGALDGCLVVGESVGAVDSGALLGLGVGRRVVG